MVSEIKNTTSFRKNCISLNPCSCGGWSQSQKSTTKQTITWSLNPCSCGGWSQRIHFFNILVLILKSLNPCSCGGWSQRNRAMCPGNLTTNVLILVLVEDGLRVVEIRVKYSDEYVLILVLVEDGLREDWGFLDKDAEYCLNPCSCGGWSQS